MKKIQNCSINFIILLVFVNIMITTSFIFNLNKTVDNDSVIFEVEEVIDLETATVNPKTGIIGTISNRTGKIFSDISVSNQDCYINKYQPYNDNQPNLNLQNWSIASANMKFENIRVNDYEKYIETRASRYIVSSLSEPTYIYQKFSIDLSQYINYISIFIKDYDNSAIFNEENSWEVAILNCSNDKYGTPNETIASLLKHHPTSVSAHWEIFDFRYSGTGPVFLDITRTNSTIEGSNIKYWFAYRVKIPPEDAGGSKRLYFNPDSLSNNGVGDMFKNGTEYYDNFSLNNVKEFLNDSSLMNGTLIHGNLSSFQNMDDDRYFARADTTNLTLSMNFTLANLSNGKNYTALFRDIKADSHLFSLYSFDLYLALNVSNSSNLTNSDLYLKNWTSGLPVNATYMFNITKETEELMSYRIIDWDEKSQFMNWFIINSSDNQTIQFNFVFNGTTNFTVSINQFTIEVHELIKLPDIMPYDPTISEKIYPISYKLINATIPNPFGIQQLSTLSSNDNNYFRAQASSNNLSFEFKISFPPYLDFSSFDKDRYDWEYLYPDPVIPLIDFRVCSKVSIENPNNLTDAALEIYLGNSTWTNITGLKDFASKEEFQFDDSLTPEATWIFVTSMNMSDDNSIRMRLRYVGNLSFTNFNISIDEIRFNVYVKNARSSDITSKLCFGLNSNSIKPSDIQLKNFGISVSDDGIWESDLSNGNPTQGIYSFDVTSLWPEVWFDVSGTYSIEKPQDFDWVYSLTYYNTKILWNVNADIDYNNTYYNNTIQDSRCLQFIVPSNWSFMATYNYSSNPPDNSGGWYSTYQINDPFKTITVYNISDGIWKIAMNSSTSSLLYNLDSPNNVFIGDTINIDIQIPNYYMGDIFFEIFNEGSTNIFSKKTSLNTSLYENSTSYEWDIYSTTKSSGTYYLKPYWIFYNDTHAFLALNSSIINVLKHTANLELLNIDKYDDTYIIGNKIFIVGRLINNETGEPIEGETITAEIYNSNYTLIDNKSGITNTEGLVQINYTLPKGYKSISIILVNSAESLFNQITSVQSIEINLISQSAYDINLFLIILPYIVVTIIILVNIAAYLRYRKTKLRRFWAEEAIIIDDLLKISYIMIVHKDAGVFIYDKQISLHLNDDLNAVFRQALSVFRIELESDTQAPIKSKEFEMDYYNLKKLIINGDFIRVVLILKEIPSEKLKENQKLFTEQFEKKYEAILKNFKGDIKPFKETDDLIEIYFSQLILGNHFGATKLKDLEKDLIEIAEQIQKERKFFFVSSILNFALAGGKASRDEIIGTMIALKRKGLIKPMNLE